MTDWEIVVIRGQQHVVWECRTCGAVSTCPKVVMEQHKQEGGYHSCPTGHQWGWSSESCEREQLRRERDRLKQDAARLIEERHEAMERANRAEAAQRRLKKRAAAGTCPCCQRTFANMAIHMKRQHPEYVRETGANVVPLKQTGH